MSTDFFNSAGIILGGAWDMLTTICFPGTNIPIAVALGGAAAAAFSLVILGRVLGFSINPSSVIGSASGLAGSGHRLVGSSIRLGGALSQRGGNNDKIKVSKERINDRL